MLVLEAGADDFAVRGGRGECPRSLGARGRRSTRLSQNKRIVALLAQEQSAEIEDINLARLYGGEEFVVIMPETDIAMVAMMGYGRERGRQRPSDDLATAMPEVLAQSHLRGRLAAKPAVASIGRPAETVLFP